VTSEALDKVCGQLVRGCTRQCSGWDWTRARPMPVPPFPVEWHARFKIATLNTCSVVWWRSGTGHEPHYMCLKWQFEIVHAIQLGASLAFPVRQKRKMVYILEVVVVVMWCLCYFGLQKKLESELQQIEEKHTAKKCKFSESSEQFYEQLARVGRLFIATCADKLAEYS